MRRAPAILDPAFLARGSAPVGENAVPVFEGFRHGSQGIRSLGLREGANPQ